jgi:hypothetical protein
VQPLPARDTGFDGQQLGKKTMTTIETPSRELADDIAFEIAFIYDQIENLKDDIGRIKKPDRAPGKGARGAAGQIRRSRRRQCRRRRSRNLKPRSINTAPHESTRDAESPNDSKR